MFLTFTDIQVFLGSFQKISRHIRQPKPSWYEPQTSRAIFPAQICLFVGLKLRCYFLRSNFHSYVLCCNFLEIIFRAFADLRDTNYLGVLVPRDGTQSFS
uniref:Uncharacterized protein n=1 Tax=Opuntia streptacantha TaxID=393608 RepID=A0A7C9AMJ8_OPUST